MPKESSPRSGSLPGSDSARREPAWSSRAELRAGGASSRTCTRPSRNRTECCRSPQASARALPRRQRSRTESSRLSLDDAQAACGRDVGLAHGLPDDFVELLRERRERQADAHADQSPLRPPPFYRDRICPPQKLLVKSEGL